MATKCLDIFQVLVSQGQNYSFSLTIGSKFPFETNIKMGSATLEARRKNLSPSQVRRNVKRKEDFLKKKSRFSQKDEHEQENLSFKWLHFFVLGCTWLHFVSFDRTTNPLVALGCT